MPPETAAEPHMMPLRVTRKEEIAQGITLFECRDQIGAQLPAFTAGAHVTIRTPAGHLRKYSLCSDPAQRDRYEVAVKRENTGRGGSIDLIEHLRVGHLLPTTVPVNDFALPGRAQDFVFVAGGIGITPFIAMIAELRAQPGKRFRLYYCSRSPETTAFLRELSAPEFADSVIIHHDQGDPACSLDLQPILKERRNREHLYCCGPTALMHAVRDMTGHWTPTSVHFEAFAEPEKARAGDTPFTVKLARAGDEFEVPVGATILEVMRQRGHVVPSSCETGTCGTCRTKLLQGEADHRDLSLAPHERAENIMICVSRARSPLIVLDR
jgi:phthalate 4,5-dioxygenase reductase component